MKASEATIDWLLERLEGVEGGNGSWSAFCPCHDDVGTTHKGLSITVSGKRILAKCHSPQCGASLPKIVAALDGDVDEDEPRVTVRKSKKETERPKRVRGLKGLDWWTEKTQVPADIWTGLGVVEFETGIAFTFEGETTMKVRKPPKEMFWVPESAETFPLWPYPPDPMPEHILITEGESDCGTARYAELPTAFAVTKGAKTDLSTDAFLALHDRGVREVSVCADADEAGHELRSRLVRNAIEAGLTVYSIDLSSIIDPFSGITDLNGVWKASEDKAHFLELIERCTQTVQLTMPTLSYEDLLEISEQEAEWMVDGLIAPGDKVLISGPMKAYKTWIMLDLARTLVSGAPFLKRQEWKGKEARRVLIVEEEGSEAAFGRRIKKMDLTPEEGKRVTFLHRKGIRFTEPDTIAFLIDICRRQEIDVLFLDPLQRMIPGVNENDSSETGVVWDEVFRLQQLCPGLAVVILHHANKTERLSWESVRGSSRHGGEVDVGIFVEKHPTEDHAVRIAVDGRDVYAALGAGEAFSGKVDIQEHTFAIDATEVSVVVRSASSAKEGHLTAIADALKGGCETRTQIMRETGLSDVTVRKHIQTLVDNGDIEEGEKQPGKPTIYTWKENDGGTDDSN